MLLNCCANAAMAANAGTMLEALNRHNGTNGVSATNDVSERSFASTQLWYGSLQYSLNTTMVTNATAAMVANATMAPNAGTMIISAWNYQRVALGWK